MADAEFVGDLLDLSRKAHAINAAILLKELGVVLGEEGDHCPCMDCWKCGNCVACGDCPCEEPEIYASFDCERHPVSCGAVSGRHVCDRIKGHEDSWHRETVPAEGLRGGSKIKWMDGFQDDPSWPNSLREGSADERDEIDRGQDDER